jgi:antitoxin HicB
LITEGDSIADALENVRDALAAVIERYRDFGRPLPSDLCAIEASGPVVTELLVEVP